MSGSFDSSAYDDVADEDQAVDQIVQELDDEDIDEELREAEKCLAKAAYYKALVNSGVIEADGSDEATEVNAEARVWARQQMAKLIGRKAPDPVHVPTPSQFTENEVKALKQLAARALQLAGERAAEPVVKTVSAPVAPQVKTVASTRPVVKPAIQQKSKKPAPPQSKPKKQQQKQAQPKKVDYDKVPSGEVFTDLDGQQYRFVDNPKYDPSIQGSKPRTKCKVTNQVRDTQAIPMPSREGMSAITADQAARAVSTPDAVESGNPDGQYVTAAIRLSQQ